MTDEQIEALKDFEDDDLLEELRNRGVDLCQDCEPDLGMEETSALIEELRNRDENYQSLAEFFSDGAVDAWIRQNNPPQAVRDAYWQTVGRIL
jgi:hypothetical protein